MRTPGHSAGTVLALFLLVVSAGGLAEAASQSVQLQQARRLFEAGRYAQAIGEFRRIAASGENTSEAVIAGYYVGLTEERRGNRDGAITAYRALLSRHGESTEMAGFARQRLRELESGAPPRAAEVSDAAVAPAVPAPDVTTTAAPTAVDRLAQSVLSDIMSSDRGAARVSRRAPPSRRSPRPIAASPAPVWPSAGGGSSSAGADFPVAPEASFPIASALGPVPGPSAMAPRYPSPSAVPDYPLVTSITWGQGASAPSRGTLATSSPDATMEPAAVQSTGYQPLGEDVARATHVRRSMPTTALATDVSSPGAGRPVAASTAPVVTWEVSVEPAASPVTRPAGRVPPPASGTALGGPRGFAWPQGDPEGLPPLGASRPSFSPIAIPADVPSLLGSDPRSAGGSPSPLPAPRSASPTPAPGGEVGPAQVPPPSPVPAPLPAARPEDRAAALGTAPWAGLSVGAPVGVSLPALTVEELAPAPQVNPSPTPQAATAPVQPLEGWLLPSPSAVSPISQDPYSLPAPLPASGGSVGGDFGDLSLPSPSLTASVGIPSGARPPSVSALDQPLAPIELAPTGVPGQTLAAPGPSAPWVEKALSLKRLGQYPEAIEAYRQALLVDTGNPVVLNNLADLLVEQGGDLDEAIRLVKDALAAEIADRGPYFSTLGWAYARRGDLDEAEKYLDEAVRVAATASRLYRRGRVYAALGQAARARADFDRALVYAEDAATASLVRQALAEMDQPIPGQGTPGIIR